MAYEKLRYWCELYRKHKRDALAVDIETTHYDGPISIISMYRKKSQWDAELTQFVKDNDPHAVAIGEEIRSAKLLITFNGLSYDIPKIKEEYPNVIPEKMPVLDLCVFARAIGLKGGLKNMEKVMGLKRSRDAEQAEGKTHQLWKKIQQIQSEEALMQLLEYAAHDVRNLFELTEWLIQWAEAKMALEKAPVNRIEDHAPSAILKMF